MQCVAVCCSVLQCVAVCFFGVVCDIALSSQITCFDRVGLFCPNTGFFCQKKSSFVQIWVVWSEYMPLLPGDWDFCPNMGSFVQIQGSFSRLGLFCQNRAL